MKINYEKIKNYNQLLLSIAGTVGILFFLGIGVFILFESYQMYSYSNDYEEGIIAQEVTEELLKDSLRKQIISFDQVYLIDSLNEIFILPASQANLKDQESVNGLIGLTNSHGNYRKNKINNYSEGTFNNLVIYDAKNNRSEIIFKKRISINNYRTHVINNQKYILISGTDKDSNNDKYLNSLDLQEFFIYDLNLQELTRMELKENYTLLRLIEPSRSNELFGKFGLDRNNDGSLNIYEEPMIIYKIDIENKKLIKILDEEQINTIQELLEGK